MICPKCESQSTVVNSRPMEGGAMVYRRRQCTGCDLRFTSFESFVDELPGVQLMVDGRVRWRSIRAADELMKLLGFLEQEDRDMVLALARRLADQPHEAAEPSLERSAA